MRTFIIGLVILALGGAVYGRICEKIFRPDPERKTPAVSKADGVDFVVMPKWKNCLIQLLNIAGTGPVLGPIQGILFGPIAFITIPIGCVIGGAVHDYMSGMISIRSDGAQMPELVSSYLGKRVRVVYLCFLSILLLLVGAVFVYTPGDLLSTTITGNNSTTNPVLWIIYGIIFIYYIIATLFPIDKIIGKIYPIFGGVLLLSAVAIFVGLFVKGYPLDEIKGMGISGVHPLGQNFIPTFFVTVACGIVSGFHSTQSTLIARTVGNEREGRLTFYVMMILEGFIAMVWAAAAMGIYNLKLADSGTAATDIVGIIAQSFLGSTGGTIAVIGVVVLAITSGDTALRSLRLMFSEAAHIDQQPKKNRVLVSLGIFTIVGGLLVFAKTSAGGFNMLWRYFAWGNQVIAVFTFAIATRYLKKNAGNRLAALMPLIPGAFYAFIVSTYILNAKIGFNIPLNISIPIGIVLGIVYVLVVLLPKQKTT